MVGHVSTWWMDQRVAAAGALMRLGGDGSQRMLVLAVQIVRSCYLDNGIGKLVVD